MKTLSLFILLLLASPVFAQTVVEGTVTDANGKAPILAHAHIEKYNDTKNSKSYECTKDGHFTIKIPKAGIYSLRISAVNQQEISIPLILEEKDKSVQMNVQLRANAYNKNPDKITVIGDWNKFAFASSDTMAVMLATTEVEGLEYHYKYQRIATGDTLSYQLMGIAEGGHSVNGTQADYFTYDGGGDYRSVIRTHKGEKVTINFISPMKVKYAENNDLPNVEIKNNSYLKKVVALDDSMTKWKNSGAKQSVEWLDNKLLKAFEDAGRSGDKKFTQFAAVMFTQNQVGGADGPEVLSTVPASSPLWAFAPLQVNELTKRVYKKLGDEYREGLKKNPEKSVRAVIYADEMEQAIKINDTAQWRKLYALLKKEYNDVPDIKWTIIQNNPDAVVQVGRPVPAFEVALLDGSGKVSNTSMLGKYYMMDFWATWCGPCVREMPAIHKAYEKFKGMKGFQIISFSMDASDADVAPFRAKKWKMPWLHAFIPGIFEADLAKKFEVAGIPKPILVGPDGNIIAMQEELRGDELEKTLAKFLGQSN